MKVSVELSDNEMAEILDLTGERKKGPAIRRLMEEALQQRRRACWRQVRQGSHHQAKAWPRRFSDHGFG